VLPSEDHPGTQGGVTLVTDHWFSDVGSWKSYNDYCDPISSSFVAEHRSGVGGDSGYRMCPSRSHANARRTGMLPPHGRAMRSDRDAREPLVLPNSESPLRRSATGNRFSSDAALNHCRCSSPSDSYNPRGNSSTAGYLPAFTAA
jgi:hypothetical protein